MGIAPNNECWGYSIAKFLRCTYIGTIDYVVMLIIKAATAIVIVTQ